MDRVAIAAVLHPAALSFDVAYQHAARELHRSVIGHMHGICWLAVPTRLVCIPMVKPAPAPPCAGGAGRCARSRRPLDRGRGRCRRDRSIGCLRTGRGRSTLNRGLRFARGALVLLIERDVPAVLTLARAELANVVCHAAPEDAWICFCLGGCGREQARHHEDGACQCRGPSPHLNGRLHSQTCPRVCRHSAIFWSSGAIASARD
jgi:hypothetical protein